MSIEAKGFRPRSLRSSAALKCIRWNLTDVSRKVALLLLEVRIFTALSAHMLWFWWNKEGSTNNRGFQIQPVRDSILFNVDLQSYLSRILLQKGLIDHHQKVSECWWIASCSKNVRNSLRQKCLVRPYCLEREKTKSSPELVFAPGLSSLTRESWFESIF
jgi:hypothetical protein